VCSSRTKSKKKKNEVSMLNITTTNDCDYHRQNVVIGDILLHSESKITIIQVIIQSLSTIPSSTHDKPLIRRLSPNSSGTIGSQTLVPCDLKNTTVIKVTHERTKTSSSKKIIRMHKAGLALVKELKSKVGTSSKTTTKSLTANTDAESERTHF
jgi:hypothetical protein